MKIKNKNKMRDDVERKWRINSNRSSRTRKGSVWCKDEQEQISQKQHSVMQPTHVMNFHVFIFENARTCDYTNFSCLPSLPFPRKTSLAFYAVFVQNLSVFVCVCVSVLLILLFGVVSHSLFKFISILHELCVCVHLCIHQNVLRVCYISSSSKFIHFFLSL